MSCKIVLIAAIAATLALASAAQAATVTDPDEPGFAQGEDIEWASSSWWGPPGKVLITHTIKTYGPYADVTAFTREYLPQLPYIDHDDPFPPLDPIDLP